MVSSIHMRLLVNVESKCKLSVSLKPCAFLIARQCFAIVAFASLGSSALHLLLLSLASTSDEDLTGTRLFFLAGIWSMAGSLIGMAANLLLLAARLRALDTMSILALSRTMARLAAEMGAAAEFLPANITTADISQPAGLVLQVLLATHTPLLTQEWAFWARVIVLMAIVGDLRMAASLWSLARVSARRRLCAAR